MITLTVLWPWRRWTLPQGMHHSRPKELKFHSWSIPPISCALAVTVLLHAGSHQTYRCRAWKKEGYSASMCRGLEARINGLIPRSFQNFLSTLTNGEVGQANFHFNHSSTSSVNMREMTMVTYCKRLALINQHLLWLTTSWLFFNVWYTLSYWVGSACFVVMFCI